MLLRRLYSSATSHRSTSLSSTTLSHLPTAARPQTRGRIRPRLPSTLPKPRSKHSLSTSAVAKPARIAAGALQGRGRKPRHPASSFVPASASASASATASSAAAAAAAAPQHSHRGAAAPALMKGGIPRAPRLTFTHPMPALNHVNEFRPIYLYPEQFKLHATFTHPAHPLPLFLGTKQYTAPAVPREGGAGGAALSAEMSWEEMFRAGPEVEAAEAEVEGAGKAEGNALGEHLAMLTRLSPELASEQVFSSESLFGTPELELATIPAVLEGKAAELKRENEIEWASVLEKMDGVAMRAEKMVGSEEAAQKKMDAEMKEVVGELAGVLARLGMGVGAAAEGEAAEVVEMDSTKRKRRSKVTKHKYKKRRKATRALRKRLGK